LLIADEPTTALDVTTQAQILHLLRNLQREHGTAVLFITHDFGVVAEIADRVAVLQRGVMVEEGPALSVLRSPQHSYTQLLLAAVPALVPPKRPAAPPALGVPALEAVKISKIYRQIGRGRATKALDTVSLALMPGETLGIVGESGSGKSTLARVLTGLIPIEIGAVNLAGVPVTHLSRAQRRPLRKRVQMVFQDPYASLDPRQRAGDIIAEGPIIHGANATAAWARAIELLSLVGLDASAAHRYPHEFSGGQRQRIGIARALALDPEILVADEAVSALDVSVQAQVLHLLETIKTQLGLSMLFVTHDLRVALQICDRIAVMRAGRVVELARTSDIYHAPQDAYTRALFAAVPGAAWTEGTLEPAS
jgi:peptide/nickel transport system ATP-binding protein